MSRIQNPKHKTQNVRSQPRVAIVHDWLYGGGAELVVLELHKMFPEAPIYTSFSTNEWRQKLDNKVVTGYLQNWPFAQLRKFLPVLRQHWFKNLDLSEFDLVISSSGNGEAKFVLSGKKQKAKSKKFLANSKPKDVDNQTSNIKHQTSDAQRPLHICYCHTPTHFYWRKYEEYLKNPGFKPKWLVRLGLKLLVKPLRERDYKAAQHVDYFIANSSHIQNDIKEYYNKDSIVIHPPVDVDSFSKKQKAKSKKSESLSPSDIRYQISNMDATRPFIMWGRHVPYKRFDIAIRACNELKLPLVIAGQGPATAELKKIAGPTITFTGFVSKEEIIALASHSKAFLFPAEEDFGIAPVEAMALGLPVIAYKSGGALDYITKETGLFFDEQTVKSIISTINSLSDKDFDSALISNAAAKFSRENFQIKLSALLNSKLL